MAQSKEQIQLPQPFLDLIASKGQTLLDCTNVHPDQTCLQYDWLKLRQIGGTALKIYVVIHIIPTIIFKHKQLRKDPIPTLKRMLINYIRSVLFLTLACALPPILQCYTSKLFGRTNRDASLLSLTISSIVGVFFETVQRQREIGLFLLPKAIPGLYSFFYVRGLAPKLGNIEVPILILAVGLIGLASSQTGRKDALKPMFDKLLCLLWD
ncbi:UNKNOWN [Stylonychia lemnae]|uniref:Transmembrane protein 135 N-terminal domain-containing protein n=1 Tax=Stylonychia lemnae TaxID=5949 RepID=A0A078APC6_STYLE|nr:UNKNOWN [Stylonychia lemnae]|eukprot:CDW84220.1 UNKNOWN [Stylonychia lemnae]